MAPENPTHNIEKVYEIEANLDDVWDCLADGNISSVWQLGSA